VKLHTNGALILVRLGKVSLRHTETMIPRGRVDEITKEPKRFEKGHCRPCRGLGPSPQISGHQNRLLIWRELWSAPIGAHQFGPRIGLLTGRKGRSMLCLQGWSTRGVYGG